MSVRRRNIKQNELLKEIEQKEVSNGTIEKTQFSLREIFKPAIPGASGRERAAFVGRWLFFGTIIGVTSGIGAIVLSLCITIATNSFLGQFVGYFSPEAAGEGVTKLAPITQLWYLPVITTVGGLLSGLLVFFFAPDAEGHCNEI